MRSRILAALVIAVSATASAQGAAPQAEFLFVGSYHMGNPGRDVHNTKADDVLSDKRQRELKELAQLLERYRPTKVMVEAGAERQDTITARFAASCKGTRPLTRNETEQLGFRIACDLRLATVHAVDWNELGPIKNEELIDYRAAVERLGQQKQFEAYMATGAAENAREQALLDGGTVTDMLRYLNSEEYRKQNAVSYARIALFGTPAEPIGANWVQLWFGRNLNIFNNIVRRTEPGDRVLVIYGAGHGNMLRQLAIDSGMYTVQDPLAWLSPALNARK